MRAPVELSSSECEVLLRAGVAGRVAVSTPTGPHILPINYSVVDDTIVVRTSPYSVLGTFGRDSMVAFEVDQFDYEDQLGWSVVARGRAVVVTDPEEIAHIRSIWPPRPWASGTRNLHLRLRWTELSGRRLGSTRDCISQLPVLRRISVS